jgi:hypothetical protein
LAVALAATMAVPVVARAASDKDSSPDAAFLQAAGSGCADCKVLTKTRACFPHLGLCADAAKVFDPKAKVAKDVLLDVATAKKLDYDLATLRALDLQQGYLVNGPVDEGLVAAMAEAGPGETLPVIVWLKTYEFAPPREDLEADPYLAAEVEATKLQEIGTVQVEFAQAAAGKVYGIPGFYYNAPAAFVRATPGEILYLSSLETVAAIYLWQPSQPLADTSSWYSTIDAGCSQCNSASGMPVCEINPKRPDQTSTLTIQDYQLDPPNGLTDAHSRWVMGFIRSTGSSGGGAASASTDYMGNWDTGTSNSGVAMNWCASSGAKSWVFAQSTTTAEDRLMDYWTKNSPYPLIAGAAGNGGSTAYADNRGFNVLCVGGSDDLNDSTRSNDVIWTSSSSKNPSSTHNDRELPAITAPAYNLTAANYTSSGTSGAAAQVAAAAAQIQYINSGIRSWPEAQRAILMCTADENVDGVVLNLTDSNDDRDGAGELNIGLAANLAQTSYKVNGGNTAAQLGYDYGSMDLVNGFDGNGYYNEVYNAKYTLSGMRIRVVLTWDSTASCTSGSDPASCTSDTLDADLDIQVFANGSLVASSASYDNSYEFVEFAATANQTYQIKIYKASKTANSTYFGIAWNTWVYGS